MQVQLTELRVHLNKGIGYFEMKPHWGIALLVLLIAIGAWVANEVAQRPQSTLCPNTVLENNSVGQAECLIEKLIVQYELTTMSSPIILQNLRVAQELLQQRMLEGVEVNEYFILTAVPTDEEQADWTKLLLEATSYRNIASDLLNEENFVAVSEMGAAYDPETKLFFVRLNEGGAVFDCQKASSYLNCRINKIILVRNGERMVFDRLGMVARTWEPNFSSDLVRPEPQS